MFNPDIYDTHMIYFLIACFFVLVCVKNNQNTSAEASTQVNNSLVQILMIQACVIFVFTILGTLDKSLELEQYAFYRFVYGSLGAIMGFINFFLPYYLFLLLRNYIIGKKLFLGFKQKFVLFLFSCFSIYYFVVIGTLIFEYTADVQRASSVLYKSLVFLPIVQVALYILNIPYFHKFICNILDNSFASRKVGYVLEFIFILGPIIGCPFSFIYHYPITFAFLVSFTFVVQMLSQDRAISVDFLTGLNNRKELYRYLKRVFEKTQELDHNQNLIFIDINDFKGVNDTYGHNVGDKALICLSDCLKKASAKLSNCFVCRYAGDEFTVVLKVNPSFGVEDYKKRLQGLIDDLNRSMVLPFELSVSIGHVQYQERFLTIDDFIHEADINMYAQKEKIKATRRMQFRL